MHDAKTMLSDLVGRCAEKPLFTSDELPHYAEVLWPSCFIRWLLLSVLVSVGAPEIRYA
jgi:hypothetical protein